jgi:hypothetical protein
MPTQSQPPDRRPIATEPGARLGTLLEDLLWPRLFESAGLALRPERLILALLTIVLLGLLGSANLLWSSVGEGGEPFMPAVLGSVAAQINIIWAGLWSFDFESVRFGLERLLSDVPRQVWVDHTASVIVLGPLLVLVWGVGGVAICRSGACEFALGLALPWPRTVAFALERWRTVLAAFFGPWLFIGFLALIVWVFGLVMSVPWVGVVAAVVFGLVLFVAAAAVLLMIGYALGLVLIAPAIACEGTDAIDAMQRAYARALGRPFRLLLYMLIAAGIGIVAIGAVSLFVDGLRGFVVEVVGSDLVNGDGRVASVLALWLNLLGLLAAAYALSYFHTASTAVYLILRQVADRQDIADLWMPGLVEGTMTQTLQARGQVAGKAKNTPE